MRRLCFLPVLFLLLTVLTSAQRSGAVDYTFDGGAALGSPAGDYQAWGDARNWSPDGVPGPGDSATVGTTNFSTVIVSGNVTVARFTLIGGQVRGGAITTTQSTTLQGGLVVSSLNIAAGAVFNLTDDTSFSEPGTINNAGTFNSNGHFLTTFATTTLPIINNSGTMNFTVNDGIGGSRGTSESILNNTGTIRKRGTGQTGLSLVTLNNNGIVDVQGGVLLVQSARTANSRGTYNTAVNSTVRLTGINVFQNARFTGPGRTELAGSETSGSVIAGAQAGGPGNFVLTGAPVNGTLNLATVSTGKFIVESSRVSGIINIPAGSTLDMAAEGQMDFESPGVINNNGIFNLNGGRVSRFSGGAPPVFNNIGTLNFKGGDSMGGSGDGIKLINTGVVRKLAGTAQSALSFITLSNNGLIDVLGGTLIAQGEAVSLSKGEFRAANGAFIRLQNRNTFQNARFTGAGTTELIGLGIDGTALVGTAPNGDGDLRVKGADLVGSFTITTAGAGTAAVESAGLLGSLTVPVGTTIGLGGIVMRENSTITNNGTVNYDGSVAYSGNNAKFNNNGTLNIRRGSNFFNNGATTTADLRNTGIINFDTAVGSYDFGIDFVQTATGRLNIKVGGPSQGTQHDYFSTRSAVLGGTLNVDLINNFVPQAGQEFHVLRYTSGTHSGRFTSIGGPFSATYGATEVLLEGLDSALLVSVTPGTFSEAGGVAAAAGRVTRIGATTAALTVNLRSSDTGEASVPASVIIPAGATAVTFRIAAVDDTEVDGPHQVTITATATGLPAATELITVTDNDIPRLQLTIATTSFNEGGGSAAAIGTLTRNTPVNTAQVVNLRSSDTSEASVPATVTIPVGAVSVSFRIAAVDDTLTDGAQGVTITAAAEGFASSAIRVTVTDNDIVLRTTVAPSTFLESAGVNAATGTISRGAAAPTALIVALSSSNPARATVPANVTIPAGAASVTFRVAAINNNLLDGSAGVVINATAAGFVPSSVGLTILDDELENQRLIARNLSGRSALSLADAYSAQSILVLQFSVPLDADSAAIYTVSINGEAVDVEAVKFDDNRNSVILFLPENSLQPGDSVTASWNGLRSRQGQGISGATTVRAR